MSAPSEDPLAIWNRLSAAQRYALKCMRGARFLYRSKNGWRQRGSAKLISRETVRILMHKRLVHEQTLRRHNPLFLTPLGKAAVEASEQRAAERQRRKQARQQEAVRKANRRAYQAAMDGCGDCVNGYTIACKTPEECDHPERGCLSCMTKCQACYETEGERL
jgi:hypothetical protein